MMIYPARSSGNAFIYVLIAVILLGALTFALSKTQDSDPGKELTSASTKTIVTSILAYESAARSAVDTMIMNGTNVDDIDYTLPSAGTFNTAPTINKLFHPNGGGLQYKKTPKGAGGTYSVGRYNNIVWTPTTAEDIIFSAYSIKQAVCEALLYKTSGVAPVLMGSLQGGTSMSDFFLPSGSHLELTSSRCSNCNERAAYCVRDGVLGSSTTKYTYYSILVAR